VTSAETGLDGAGGSAVDGRGGAGRAEVDPGLGEALGAADRLGDRGLGDHRVLRQRRALVGRVRLLADQRDAAGVPGVAQRFRGPAAGLAGADDDDRARSVNG